MNKKTKIGELSQLLTTYKLPYGHLIYNNSNYWLKTSKMRIFKYPNIKVRRHEEAYALQIFRIEDGNLYYRDLFILSADAVNEQKFIAYKFHKKNDEIILEEYQIKIADYFYKFEVFTSFSHFKVKLERLRLRDGCKLNESTIIRRSNVLLLIEGKYHNKEYFKNEQLDFTKIPDDQSYVYAHKNKLKVFCSPHLKIVKKDKIQLFDIGSSPVIDLGNISVYKKKCLILNVNFVDYYKKFLFCCTSDSIYLIYKGVIVCKKESNVIGGSIKKMNYRILNNYIQKKSMADMLFLLGLFFEYTIHNKNENTHVEMFNNQSIKPFELKNIENIMILLILSKYHRFIEPFLADIFNNDTLSVETFYSNLYRRVDDQNRSYLQQFYKQPKSIENLHKIILFKFDEMRNFVQIAIEQKKEYFINELLNFLIKKNLTSQLEQLANILLSENLFYLFSQCISNEDKQVLEQQIENILLVEKNNMKGQFNRDMYYFK